MNTIITALWPATTCAPSPSSTWPSLPFFLSWRSRSARSWVLKIPIRSSCPLSSPPRSRSSSRSWSANIWKGETDEPDLYSAVGGLSAGDERSHHRLRALEARSHLRLLHRRRQKRAQDGRRDPSLPDRHLYRHQQSDLLRHPQSDRSAAWSCRIVLINKSL